MASKLVPFGLAVAGCFVAGVVWGLLQGPSEAQASPRRTSSRRGSGPLGIVPTSASPRIEPYDKDVHLL